MRLLYIEDHADILEQVTACLREESFAVDAVDNGSDGLWMAENNDYDAIVLAAAGINRLAEGAERGENDAPDVSSAVCITIDAADFVPAPSQGALALQVREATGGPRDQAIFDAIRTLHDHSAERGVLAERELLRLIQAGCEAPFGAWTDAAPDSGAMTLHAIFAEGGILRRVAVKGTDSLDIARRAFAELGLGGEK